MNLRPRASLARILDDLGATLLDLVQGDPERVPDIGGVVIHDPVDLPVLPPQALVLGVGLTEPADVAALLRELGRHAAGGLVLRAPVQLTEEVRRACDESQVTLLALSRGAAWAQLAALLRSLLAEGDIGVAEPETLGGVPSGDLFAVANAISALLDAPITIEDRSSRVLAFSGRQDEADQSRVETILGRQVPERYARLLTERGVFSELYRTEDPILVPPADELDHFVMPRVAVAVRAGDEVLGSIWAAVREPLSPERTDALRDAAKLVALHLLRVRAGADVRRRLRADLVSTALEGGPGAREALERLGLANQAVMVLGAALARGREEAANADAEAAAERERLADAFAVHLGAVHPRSAAALVGGVAYGLVPVAREGQDGEDRATRIATDFLDRIGERTHAVVGVGPVARDVGSLARSRAGVDRVLRVLGGGQRRRVARASDVRAETLVLELRDVVAARGDGPSAPLARLLEYDVEHDSHLVDTLRAWLDHFGDAHAAAEAMFVHANTFRYRLRRAAEIACVDLTDPDTRFALMLELRVLG